MVGPMTARQAAWSKVSEVQENIAPVKHAVADHNFVLTGTSDGH